MLGPNAFKVEGIKNKTTRVNGTFPKTLGSNRFVGPYNIISLDDSGLARNAAHGER